MRRRPEPARRSDSERRIAAVDQGEERAVDHLRVLEHDQVPGVLDDDVLGLGQQQSQLVAVLRRRHRVLGPAEDQHLDVEQRRRAPRGRRAGRTPGRKSATTSIRVEAIISAANRTSEAGTGEAKE